ncbi:unnamed protein product [Clavelina lepadiformis]|uniref:Helicase C-terminal domain-containing protein n=1 Tax=Clavelina lepadiformis TaxID=159417 RepID=A0ABP0FPC7_CLALP
MDAEPARVPTTQSITLQYQTAHGTTKWATIPNGQIRQLPGGVVQIVTSSVNSRSSTPIPPAQDSIAESETEVTAVTRKGLNKKKLPAETYTRMLARKRVEKKESILSRLSRINDRRCEAEATYLPSNTISFLQSITTMFPTTSEKLMYPAVFENAVKSPLQRLKHLIFVLDRFIFVIPKVATSSVECEVAHPTPWRYYSLSSSLHHLRTWLSHELSPLHRITRKTRVQFPETRLIEYDCGKLQVLNVLLRRFWEEKHRILIFTQMTKVLDILEAFLSYHGYRYLRLDGSTHIEQRMARMERFNNDPRIFCFILSTRSGGIGVNLTGADTVVFYDSDWNPTMDAQAQDRCHRIGQTRDVHIYRLINEKTVEENILKKANQKRLLGDLAIEGGGFTTAFFQQQAIKDLFDDPSGLEELTEQPRQLTARQKALEAAKAENNEEVASEKQDLEKALLESEEKEDVVAAEMLKQEQDAVMEEFVDAEDKAGEEAGENLKLRVPKGSKVEEELKGIYQELSPVERYALHYLEESAEATNDLELQEAEAQVEQSKKDWELAHLVALKEEEERRLEEADEIFYTREGNQVNLFSSSSESSLSDEEVVKRKSKSKQPRKKPAAQKKKIVKAPSRGRGRRQSGVNRMEMKQKRTIILDAVSSSDSVCVDESYNREGDPLWREYEQETAGYLVQSDDSSDDNRWDFSSEEHIYDNELNSYEYRESPLWRVAEETEKSIHNSNLVNESSNVDYGPCEITSFSKSGRPRKRNKRLCEDEFEVFSPGSGFSDSTIPFSAPKPKEAVYNVVVETDKSKLSKQAVKSKKNPIISLKSLGIKANMTTNLPSTKPVPSRMTSNQRSTVILPFSFVQANAPVRSLTPMQARFANPVSTISPIRFTANVVQPQRHNNQTIVIQQTSLPQISQMKIVSTSSQSVIANSNSSHTVNSDTTSKQSEEFCSAQTTRKFISFRLHDRHKPCFSQCFFV